MFKIFSRQPDTQNDPYCGISLGDKARCSLTGFTGIVIGRVEHLTGCNQLYLLPNADKENELKEGQWFDIERVEKVSDRQVEIQRRYTGADINKPRVCGPHIPT